MHSRVRSPCYFSIFSSQDFTSTEAACVILACELRTSKNFSSEDIQAGVLKEHLKPEDYDLEKMVSNNNLLTSPPFAPAPLLKHILCRLSISQELIYPFMIEGFL